MRSLDAELFQELNAAIQNHGFGNLVFGEGGLIEGQIAAIESELAISLPDDVKFLMGNIREQDSGASPWSTFDRTAYEEQYNWILQGILFDVEHANLWLRRWGPQPRELEAAKNIARRDFADWPKLFPIFGHRFLAVEPCRNDNPIFSVMQTDIICYGANLAHYLLQEFGETRDHAENTAAQNPRHIEVWSDFAGDRNAILAWASGSEAAKTAPWRVN
jgi:hypothetical protein